MREWNDASAICIQRALRAGMCKQQCSDTLVGLQVQHVLLNRGASLRSDHACIDRVRVRGAGDGKRDVEARGPRTIPADVACARIFRPSLLRRHGGVVPGWTHAGV
jgi:hypothetical protein